MSTTVDLKLEVIVIVVARQRGQAPDAAATEAAAHTLTTAAPAFAG